MQKRLLPIKQIELYRNWKRQISGAKSSSTGVAMLHALNRKNEYVAYNFVYLLLQTYNFKS